MVSIPCSHCRKRKHTVALIYELEQVIAQKDRQIYRLRDKLFDSEETLDHTRRVLSRERSETKEATARSPLSQGGTR